MKIPENSEAVKKVEDMIESLDHELDDDEHEHHSHEHAHEHEVDMNVICAHDGNIRSEVYECKGKLVDLDKVDNWLSELLWDDQYQEPVDEDDGDDENKENDKDNNTKKKMDIYRMKAVLPIENGENHYLSAVQDLYEIEVGNLRWKEENENVGKDKCLCKMVVIGKFLNKDVLQKGFDSIFVD